MTTRSDHGRKKPQMLQTPVRDSGLHPSLVLALRDMRMANGRDAITGEREGNESWIGLCLGMVVLDSLSKYTAGGSDQARWTSLLKRHGISADDANTIFRLRCSLLHGYSLPKPEAVGGRRVLLTANQDAYAVDAWTGRTDHGDPAELILVSVPVFCGCLVERIAAEAPDDWDDALIDTDYRLPPDLAFRLTSQPGAFSADAGNAPFLLAFPQDPEGAAPDGEGE